MTNSERIKNKLEAEQTKIKELKEKLKAEEAAERKAKENAAKLETLCPDIAKAVEAILAKAEITLPTGKQFLTVMTGDGFTTTIVEAKVAKARGTGGTKTIDFEGEKLSWSQLAEKKGLAVNGASAHKVVFLKARELHNSIPHEHCPYK